MLKVLIMPLLYIVNLNFLSVESELNFPANLGISGAAGRRSGVTNKTKRPSEEEFHSEQWATLCNSAQKIQFCHRTPVGMLELSFQEHSVGRTSLIPFEPSDTNSEFECRGKDEQWFSWSWSFGAFFFNKQKKKKSQDNLSCTTYIVFFIQQIKSQDNLSCPTYTPAKCTYWKDRCLASFPLMHLWLIEWTKTFAVCLSSVRKCISSVYVMNN